MNPRSNHFRPEGSPTCLSTEPHDNDIRDFVTHYFGCIEIYERERFFDPNNQIWYHEEEKAAERLRDDSHGQPTNDHEIELEAKKLVQKLRNKIKASIKTQNTRNKIIFDEINKNGTGASVDETMALDETNLVAHVKKSHAAWHDSKDFKEGLPRVQKWRQQRGKPTSKEHSGVFVDGKSQKYCTKRDVNAYVIQYKLPGTALDNNATTQAPPKSDEEMVNDDKSAHFDTECCISAVLDDLVPIQEETNPRFKGSFPDQRLAASFLLDEADTILSREQNEGHIRYFHFPSNNMNWAEEAIARYYSDKKPEYDYFGNPKRNNRSSMILRSEYWRGQQNGSHGSRHMRPMCERISSDPPNQQKSRNDMVLFMPYLHWEKSRASEQMSKVLDAQAESQRRKLADQARGQKTDRKKKFKQTGFPSMIRGPKHESIKPLDKQGPASTLTEALEYLFSPKDPEALITWKGGRMIVKHSPLGQFLLDSARLYEAMSLFRDKKIVEDFMTGEATLHPRRTLDQYYYGTLKTTKARDRDQVVYRGTTRNAERAHKYKEPDSVNSVLNTVKAAFHGQRDCEKKSRKWTGHTEFEDDNGCSHCKADVQQVSQVIMVDQLWMWVLDERTIITCFPKRYGFHKHDASGVHKCIRDRLKDMAAGQMKSVYNLALVVLDECSYTFFDRTRTEHQQPQTMDIFADAIGSVNTKSTIGFEHLWHWTEKAGKIYRSKVKHVEALDLHVPLLDIHPEGKLQREIKDVIDELDMMIHVVKKQQEVIKRFTKNVEHILNSTGQLEKTSNCCSRESRRSSRISLPQLCSRGSGLGDDCTPSRHQPSRQNGREQKLISFQSQAQDLLEELDDRMEELEDLRRSAESTSQSVKDLLELKQQQAGVVQAWQAVNQADETVSQGRAIMMFTIVTIIFLPMSFISSIFGMNNSDFGTNWTFHDQAIHYMIPISTGMIFITLLLGFSDFCKAFIWWLWARIGIFILIHTQLYRIWLGLSETWNSYALYKSTEESVRRMKDEVKRAKAHRRARRTKARNGEAQGTETLPNETQRKTGAKEDRSGAKGSLAAEDRSKLGIPQGCQHEDLLRGSRVNKQPTAQHIRKKSIKMQVRSWSRWRKGGKKVGDAGSTV